LTPRKIFLFGLCFLAAIFIISVFFPEDGLRAGNFELRFPDYRTWFRADIPDYKDIRNITDSVDAVEDDSPDSDIPEYVSEKDTALNAASFPADSLLEKQPVPIDSVHSYTRPFDFPGGKDTLLYPLFRKVENAASANKPLRILHYGDSQIEADRITSTIRNFIQKKYGGMGAGFIPAVPVTDESATFQQYLSPGWKRFSLLGKQADSSVLHRRFGISGNLARYMADGPADTVADIVLKPLYVGYRNIRSFTHARLYYGPADGNCSIVINQTDTQSLAAGNIVSSAWWKFPARQTSLSLSLHSTSFPDIYGVTLDGANGVAVDNLPMRGSGGLDFSRMDTAQMGQMFRMMGAEMIILQFGANIVPNVVSSYDYYARGLSRQLKLLKSLKPGISIIVIGVNDMSRKNAGGYETYPNIAKIRDAQKQAAFETDCVFWDLYEAMGGGNSMPSWVFHEPPLAQKDFVHFTHTGAKIIAELFCRAWEKEYRKYSRSFQDK
jgi:hypothetical protein